MNTKAMKTLTIKTRQTLLATVLASLALLGVGIVPARAGSWSAPTYTVHEIIHTRGYESNQDTVTDTTQTTSPGRGPSIYCTPNMTGTSDVRATVTATWTWQPNGGNLQADPAPATATVLETSQAWWHMQYDAAAAAVSVSFADDGMKDPAVNNPAVYPDGTTSGVGRASSGQHLTLLTSHAGTMSVTHTLRATVTLTTGSNSYLSVAACYYYQAIAANASLQAWSTACAPLLCGNNPQPSTWDSQNPRYFSGTGCQAQGKASPLSGYVAHAQLCIGENGADTVIKEYWDNAQSGKPNPLPADGSVVTGTNLQSLQLSALFDSTHFMDSTPITIKLKVWDTNNGKYEAKLQGVAYNKSYILTNHTIGYIFCFSEAKDVANTLQGINYTARPSSFDNVKTVLHNVPQYTTFLVTSHANDSGFGDINATEQGDLIGWSDIATAVAQKSLYQAPYNFAFIDGCHSAGHPTQEKTDGPEGFGIMPANSDLYSTNDRAFLGWRYFVWSTLNVSWTTTVHRHLAEGYTLYDAVTAATDDGVPIGGDEATMVNPIYIPASILGDPYMTLHGVYKGALPLGSNGSSQWFRPLP